MQYFVINNNGVGNGNPSQIGCLNYHPKYKGHGAGAQISANNVGPGAVGLNNNRGPGAGGCNSGVNSGAVNCRNCWGNQAGGGSGGRVPRGRGSSGSVQRGGFDQLVYFICKFPDGYDEKTLEEILGGYGTVSSVRIPNRRDKYGNRFGFVTFLEVHDEEGLEKPDKSHDFRVNRARPRTSTVRNRMKHYKNFEASSSKVVGAQESFGNRFSGHMWVPKPLHDAVESRDKPKIMEFETEKEETDWLYRCAVGCPRGHKGYLPLVRRDLCEEGFTFCKATHFHLAGRDYVLLQCTNNGDLSTLLNKGGDLLKRHFQWVKPWSPNGEERYVFLRFEEVPPHAWTERFFRNAVDHLRGRFICMDDSSINKRVLITTTSNDISESLRVRIDSNYYNVKVIIEETDHRNSAPVDSDWDISDNDGTVVDGSWLDVEQSGGDSSDKGFHEVVGSEPHKNQHELGSQNTFSTKTLNAGAKPFWPRKTLNAEAKPLRSANLSFPLTSNRKEVSDKESAVVINGRSGWELSDGSLRKGDDEKERTKEEIFPRNGRPEFNGNTESNVQTAQQTCPLDFKARRLDLRRENRDTARISTFIKAFSQAQGCIPFVDAYEKVRIFRRLFRACMIWLKLLIKIMLREIYCKSFILKK